MSRKSAANYDDDDSRPGAISAPPRKRLRFKWIVLLAAVILLVAALPTIVAKSPLLNVVLSRAVPGGALRVAAGDASLGWLTAPSLSHVEVADAVGNPLLTADQIAISQSPLSLAMNWRNLGIITIQRPVIQIQLRPDGSNLEDVIHKIAQAIAPADPAATDSTTATEQTRFALNIVDATMNILDTTTGNASRIEGATIQYDNRSATGFLGTVAVSGRLTQISKDGAPTPAGSLALNIEPINPKATHAKLQANAISLALAEPWLARFAPGAVVAGTLTGQGEATWTNPPAGEMPADLASTGSLVVEQLDLTAAALEGDHIRLPRVSMPWHVSAQPNGWRIDDMRILSDIANLAVRGTVDPNSATARHSLETRGSLNLPKLAAMLPHALHIRPGTTITSGDVEFSTKLEPADVGQRITGSVRTTPIAATADGRQLSWDQPVTADFNLLRSPTTFQLDSLRCDSQFLKIDAAGSTQQFAANASFDLNRLAEQLGQFIDLTQIKLAGTGSAKLAWQQPSPQQFSATAVGDLSQLTIALREDAAWTEPQLALRAEAAGLLDPNTRKAIRVENAKLQINGQGDTLDAQLTAPVDLNSQTPVWPVTIKSNGRIANWLTRLRPWFSPGEWQIDGQGELNAVAQVASGAADISSIKLTVNELRATNTGWNIYEPRVEFAGDARWNAATSEVSSANSQLVSSTVTLATRDIRYRAGDNAISQLTGGAAYRADLARISSWKNLPGQSTPYQAAGQVTGNLTFAQQGDRITADLNANGQNLSLATLNTTPTSASRGVPAPGLPANNSASYKTIWQDPNVTLRAVANYQSSTDRLAFDQLQIQSNTVQAAAAGSIDRLSTVAETNLNGTLNYDLAQVTPLLWPYLGQGIQLTGREQARFAMAGQLAGGDQLRTQLTSTTNPYAVATASATTPTAAHWSRRVKAQCELPWGGANLYGMPVGPGRLAASLADGTVNIQPLSLSVGEGTLTAAPQVRLDPPPSELTLPPGPLLTNVRVSPEVSEALLKYVAPVLAGATQSEGQFSMTLDGTRVPLADSKKADIAGRLNVHSLRVVPGPMAAQLVGVVQQVESIAKRRDPSGNSPSQVTLLNLRDQQVNFRVVEGRVHHQNLEFQVNNLTLRSQGSVGFDQTLALTLQFPIPDDWVTKEPLLAGLKGQSLQIPVTGTLARPQVDGRAIAGITQQLLQGAAQQAIGGELNKALDKIFKPR